MLAARCRRRQLMAIDISAGSIAALVDQPPRHEGGVYSDTSAAGRLLLEPPPVPSPGLGPPPQPLTLLRLMVLRGTASLPCPARVVPRRTERGCQLHVDGAGGASGARRWGWLSADASEYRRSADQRAVLPLGCSPHRVMTVSVPTESHQRRLSTWSSTLPPPNVPAVTADQTVRLGNRDQIRASPATTIRAARLMATSSEFALAIVSIVSHRGQWNGRCGGNRWRPSRALPVRCQPDAPMRPIAAAA